MQRIFNFLNSRFFLSTIGVFLIAIARMPQKLFQPQFFAEDGMFFRSAYESSFLENIFRPHLNYFIVIPRIIVELIVESEQWEVAPFLFSFFCFIIYAITLSIFSTELYKKYIPNDLLRTILPFALAAFGSHYEVLGAICNLQWYLVLNALHLLVYCWDSSERLTLLKYIVLSIFSFLLALSAPNAIIFTPLFVFCFFKTKNKLPVIAYIIGSAIISYYSLGHQEGVGVQNFSGTLWEFILGIFAGIYYRGVIQNLFPKQVAYYTPEVALHIIAALLLLLIVGTLFIKRNLLGFVLIILNILYFGILIKSRAEFISTQLNFEVLIGKFGAGGASRYFYLPLISFVLISFMQLNYYLDSSRLLLKNLSYFLFLCLFCTGMSYFKYNEKYVYKNWPNNAGKNLRELKKGESMKFTVDPHDWRIDLTNNRE